MNINFEKIIGKIKPMHAVHSADICNVEKEISG